MAFVGKYNLLKDRFLQHLSTKDLYLNFPLLNAETLKRKRLLQENITHSRTGFGAFVTKTLNLNVRLMMLASQFSSKMLKHLKERGFCRTILLTQGTFFAGFVNKNVTFKCSIFDVGTTIFF